MIEAVFIVCAAVAAVSALIATVAAHKCSAQSQRAAELCTALSSERGKLAAHDAELDTITATLRKLSGRLGQVMRGQNPENSDSDDIPPAIRQINDTAAYKHALRARLGLIPGKPAPRGKAQ